MNPVVTSELVRLHEIELLRQAEHYRFTTAAVHRRSVSRASRFGRLRRRATHRTGEPVA